MSIATSEFVRGRIIAATQNLLARDGLGVSMDQIAAAAGVGRRSLFRHFGSRDVLVARALEETVSAFGARLAALLVVEAPFSAWLRGVLTEVQRSQLDAGRAYWELVASDDDLLGPQLLEMNCQRRASRRRWTADVVQRAWLLAGGDGAPPDVVVDAFALTLSRHAVRSLVEELDLEPERVVASSAAIVTAVIQEALRRDDDSR